MKQIETIVSRANPKIRDAAALLGARARKETGLFLVEGARLCADAAQFGAQVQTVFITPDAAKTYPRQFETVSSAAKAVYYITDAVAEKLSDTASSQNFFCVLRRSRADVKPDPSRFYVLTDRVQNPDNLGALARSAEAFGAAGMVVCGGCDPYAPKALRASMGALLRFPVERAESAADALEAFRTLGMPVYAAVLHKDAKDVRRISSRGGGVLVIGNEGSGAGEDVIAKCTDLVIIPMAGRAESLNAAAAGAVLLWELVGKYASPNE
ncbi:MAG: RNA methyltransferase [Clostridia bacterium]|nr:RNA methyltransferase [Clostridia bacterium]